jgi:hypothetical protein
MIELFIHKPPMKSILRAISRKHSLYHALDALNKEYGTDYTEDNVLKWNHITEEDALTELEKLKSQVKTIGSNQDG